MITVIKNFIIIIKLADSLIFLAKKAEAAKILLDDDAAYLLASRCATNIRELEGALTKLVAYAAVTGRRKYQTVRN